MSAVQRLNKFSLWPLPVTVVEVDGIACRAVMLADLRWLDLQKLQNCAPRIANALVHQEWLWNSRADAEGVAIQPGMHVAMHREVDFHGRFAGCFYSF